MKIPFLDLSRQPAGWADELKKAAADVIDSGRYLHGPQTELLEEEVAALCDTTHCVGVSNGLDALRLIMRSYMELGRLKPGDEVIVPANTYIASVLPVMEFGMVPVLAEPSAITHNLDLNRLEEYVTARTKAVMAVHLYGSPVWDTALMQSLHDRGILIIEDNAQAIGAEISTPGLRGYPATGGLGDAAAISFYPTKNIGAIGDGGAVTTSDPELARMVRTLANYGSRERYHNLYAGYNCRLDEIQAAMLRVKLSYLPRINERRRQIADIYSEEIRHEAVTTPLQRPDTFQVWHQYVVTTPHRDALQRHLAAQGIGTDIHYPVPPHLQPCLKGVAHGPLPVAERLAREVLSLPVATVTPEEAREVARAINAFSLPNLHTAK